MAFDIRDYLESYLSRCKDSKPPEVTAECPACERYGSFYANSVTGAYVCFKCDFRGRSIIGLIAHIEDIPWREARARIFRESVELRRKDDIFTLRDRIDAIRPEAAQDDEQEPEKVDVPLPEFFRPCYRAHAKKGQRLWSVPRWLRTRGVSRWTAKAWGLGWCRSGRCGGRLVIPIDCPNGRSWTARDMSGQAKQKYLNPEDADHSKLLIGWHCTPLTGDLVLCEGPFDAIKLWQHDIPALALGGKNLHGNQLDLLRALDPHTAITIMLDPEELSAPDKVAETLLQHFSTIYVAKLPEGVDPGDSTLEQAQEAIDFSRRWKPGGRAISKLRQLKRLER